MHSKNILPHKNFPPPVDAARGQIKTGPDAGCPTRSKLRNAGGDQQNRGNKRR